MRMPMKKKKTKIPQRLIEKCALVLIEWVDSSYALGWQTGDGEPQLKRCSSVGWIRKASEDAITLTANMTIEEPPQRCCEITIPRCAIRRVHKL